MVRMEGGARRADTTTAKPRLRLQYVILTIIARDQPTRPKTISIREPRDETRREVRLTGTP